VSSIVTARPVRRLIEGELKIDASVGAWPVAVRDDGGQLTIFVLEYPGAEPATVRVFLLRVGKEIDIDIPRLSQVGTGMIGGEVWAVFEGD